LERWREHTPLLAAGCASATLIFWRIKNFVLEFLLGMVWADEDAQPTEEMIIVKELTG